VSDSSHWSLTTHGFHKAVTFDTIWSGIAAGVEDAATDHAIVCRMILDVHSLDELEDFSLEAIDASWS
jgi:hypothetical protein